MCNQFSREPMNSTQNNIYNRYFTDYLHKFIQRLFHRSGHMYSRAPSVVPKFVQTMNTKYQKEKLLKINRNLHNLNAFLWNNRRSRIHIENPIPQNSWHKTYWNVSFVAHTCTHTYTRKHIHACVHNHSGMVAATSRVRLWKVCRLKIPQKREAITIEIYTRLEAMSKHKLDGNVARSWSSYYFTGT